MFYTLVLPVQTPAASHSPSPILIVQPQPRTHRPAFGIVNNHVFIPTNARTSKSNFTSFSNFEEDVKKQFDQSVSNDFSTFSMSDTNWCNKFNFTPHYSDDAASTTTVWDDATETSLRCSSYIYPNKPNSVSSRRKTSNASVMRLQTRGLHKLKIPPVQRDTNDNKPENEVCIDSDVAGHQSEHECGSGNTYMTFDLEL